LQVFFCVDVLMPKEKIKDKPPGRAVAPPKPFVIAQTDSHRAGGTREPARVFERTSVLAFLLAVVTVSLYLPVTLHPFVNYDDPAYIVENGNIQGGMTWATIRWALTTTEHANWHPLTWLSHALDFQLFGLNAGGHHAISLLLHAINACLLFVLLLYATGARWRSLAVAALFALHPINVESVAWAAERKNVLSIFFFLLTLAAYGWYSRRPEVKRYAVVALLFVLGLAAKPMIVTLPFVLFLLDFWPLQRIQSWVAPSARFAVPQKTWKWLAMEKVPLLALSAASCAVTILAQRGSMAAADTLPLGPRLANALYSYTLYLWKTLWPTRLAVFYPHEGYRLEAWQVAAYLIVLAAISLWTWMERRTRSYLLVGWLWFLGTLVPVIGLVQVGDQGMADRYAYLPLIGFFVMMVWGISDLAVSRRVGAKTCLVAAGIVFVATAFMTTRQIRTWRSTYDLWAHALDVTQDNYLAEDFFGVALLRKNSESHQPPYSNEVMIHFRNAVRINPRDAVGRLNFGTCLYERGATQDALEQYQHALQYTQDPHLVALAYIGLGSGYERLHELDKAGESYHMALTLEPQNLGLFTNLGRLAMKKRIVQLAASAAAHPTPQSYLVLGQLEQSAGQVDDARTSYERALTLDPKLEDARSALTTLKGESR
jgi:Tfp pilus assembly protein PilF